MQAHARNQEHTVHFYIVADTHILVVHASLCCHSFCRGAGRQQRSAEAGEHGDATQQDEILLTSCLMANLLCVVITVVAVKSFRRSNDI